jgi:hypothetical protein
MSRRKDTEDLAQHNVVMLQESVVCYCSNYDLHASEWIDMLGNITLIASAMKADLGKALFSF